ncbi:MAG: hypothetical protein JXR51_08370 [Bacteroidales bacterium]|nr:hypothetical protein [Bacteroidales bacterium]MBN2757176.1 hypothetical protein [Bacteroidales bacterium]
MEIKRTNIKELDKIDNLELFSLIDNKSSSSGISRLEDIVIKNGDLIEVRLNYNNGWDKKSNGLTPDARKKFIEADKIFFNNTNTNLTIHVSKRDIYKQAELYIKYKYYNEGNQVEWPGCSFHNWGLAVEMQAADKQLVIGAMNSNGWALVSKHESFYFECTGSRDYNKAAMVIKSFRTTKTGLAFKWSEQVAEYYKKAEVLNERAPIFNNKLEQNKSDLQKIKSEQDLLKFDAQSLSNKVNTFNKDASNFNIELAKANKLYDSILKIQNERNKTKKSEEYNILIDFIKNEHLRLNSEIEEIDKIDLVISNKNAKFEIKQANYRREEQWLNNEYQFLEKLSSEIEQHKNNAAMHLQSIDGQTWK